MDHKSHHANGLDSVSEAHPLTLHTCEPENPSPRLDPVYIVRAPDGTELARFDMATTPPDRDGDVIPMRAATALMIRGHGREVWEGGRLLATSVSAELMQPVDAFGSGRGRGK